MCLNASSMSASAGWRSVLWTAASEPAMAERCFGASRVVGTEEGKDGPVARRYGKYARRKVVRRSL